MLGLSQKSNFVDLSGLTFRDLVNQASGRRDAIEAAVHKIGEIIENGTDLSIDVVTNLKSIFSTYVAPPIALTVRRNPNISNNLGEVTINLVSPDQRCIIIHAYEKGEKVHSWKITPNTERLISPDDANTILEQYHQFFKKNPHIEGFSIQSTEHSPFSVSKFNYTPLSTTEPLNLKLLHVWIDWFETTRSEALLIRPLKVIFETLPDSTISEVEKILLKGYFFGQNVLQSFIEFNEFVELHHIDVTFKRVQRVILDLKDLDEWELEVLERLSRNWESFRDYRHAHHQHIRRLDLLESACSRYPNSEVVKIYLTTAGLELLLSHLESYKCFGAVDREDTPRQKSEQFCARLREYRKQLAFNAFGHFTKRSSTEAHLDSDDVGTLLAMAIFSMPNEVLYVHKNPQLTLADALMLRTLRQFREGSFLFLALYVTSLVGKTWINWSDSAVNYFLPQVCKAKNHLTPSTIKFLKKVFPESEENFLVGRRQLLSALGVSINEPGNQTILDLDAETQRAIIIAIYLLINHQDNNSSTLKYFLSLCLLTLLERHSYDKGHDGTFPGSAIFKSITEMYLDEIPKRMKEKLKKLEVHLTALGMICIYDKNVRGIPASTFLAIDALCRDPRSPLKDPERFEDLKNFAGLMLKIEQRLLSATEKFLLNTSTESVVVLSPLEKLMLDKLSAVLLLSQLQSIVPNIISDVLPTLTGYAQRKFRVLGGSVDPTTIFLSRAISNHLESGTLRIKTRNLVTLVHPMFAEPPLSNIDVIGQIFAAPQVSNENFMSIVRFLTEKQMLNIPTVFWINVTSPQSGNFGSDRKGFMRTVNDENISNVYWKKIFKGRIDLMIFASDVPNTNGSIIKVWAVPQTFVRFYNGLKESYIARQTSALRDFIIEHELSERTFSVALQEKDDVSIFLKQLPTLCLNTTSINLGSSQDSNNEITIDTLPVDFVDGFDRRVSEIEGRTGDTLLIIPPLSVGWLNAKNDEVTWFKEACTRFIAQIALNKRARLQIKREFHYYETDIGVIWFTHATS